MSVHVPPISRRRFLQVAAASVPGLLALRYVQAADADADLFALLSDTHIPATPDMVSRNANMTDNFKRVSDELLALPTKPAAVLVNGDCAFTKGLPEDYAHLATLLDPLRQAGLPLHLNLGNHDNRDTILASMTHYRPSDEPVPGRRVTVLMTPRVNWFMLDTLDKTNSTPGVMGEPQLAWLAKALDAHADKPAVIYAHHNPQWASPEALSGPKISGLTDTAALFDVLAPRRHVKAFIFGHTHHWSLDQRDGIHLINLPPTAYVFSAGQPNGWVSAQLADNAMTLTLHCLDKQHPDHDRSATLPWRA
ncbi:MAG: phosphohydrolase [Planctomycetes bacterium]|nr:phosphohydrolase [Planctomycetota bacterium]